MSSLYCVFSNFECWLSPLKAISEKVMQGKVPLFFIGLAMIMMAFLCKTSQVWDPLAFCPLLCKTSKNGGCIHKSEHETKIWLMAYVERFMVSCFLFTFASFVFWISQHIWLSLQMCRQMWYTVRNLSMSLAFDFHESL